MCKSKSLREGIAISLKAYLRFSQQIGEQLSRLEQQVRAEIPQLGRRGKVTGRQSHRR